MVNQHAIDELKKQVRGRVLGPSDTAYNEARSIYNAMIDRRPSVIVYCAGNQDVEASVRFAREHSLPLSVRGGGHNVAGNAVCDGGVMLHMGKLNGVRLDVKNHTSIAQPGATLGDYDQATTPHGLVTPMGIVSKTGIAGLTLGGGLGWLMGKYGLACDNLIGAEVVTAQGTTVQTNEKENAELLWGLRGGGGNFGIVTEFRYRLHPLQPILGGILLYSAESTREMLRFFREVTPELPDELIISAGMLDAPDGNPACAIVVGYIGDLAQGEKALAPIRAFGKPTADLVGPITYEQLQTMFDAAYPAGLCNYWKSGFMDSISDGIIDHVMEQFHRRPSRRTAFTFEHMHGLASRVPVEATAFAHRFNHFNFSIFGVWDDPTTNDVNVRWIRDVWQSAQQFLSGRAYVNYLGEEGADRVREAYGPNYARLAALKKQYDPTNFFRLNQNIPPSS